KRVKYGFFLSVPCAKKYNWRFFSSTFKSLVTTKSPLVICCFNFPVVASYKYKCPQLSLSEYQMISFVLGRYCQLIAPCPDSYWVGAVSSKTSRISPVTVLAIRNFSFL